MNNGRGEAETEEIRIAFIPIACASPLVHAAGSGKFARRGLRVKLLPAQGWNAVRALLAHGKVEAAHILPPMALASVLGLLGSRPARMQVVAVQNVNGSALLLGRRHEGIRHGKDLRGLRFGVPHRFSMHAFLLREMLAREGIDPRTEVEICEIAPPRMPRWLEKGRIDGALCPEPYVQVIVDRGIGSVLALSSDIWPGHPCCGFAVGPRLLEGPPGVVHALCEGLVEAAAELSRGKAEARRAMALQIGRDGSFRGDSAEALARVFSTPIVDLSGRARSGAERIDFVPQAFPEYAMWILAQMQRWGDLAGPIDHEKVARDVFSLPATAAIAEAAGFHAGPRMEGTAPFSVEDPFGSMQRMPFCAYQPERPAPRRYDLPEAVRGRIVEILERLAEVAGGRTDLGLSVTSDDEVGELERALNDTINGLHFARESLAEQLELEDQSLRQRALIEAQEALIQKLGAPIVPVLRGTLLLPLIGQVDARRAASIQEALLGAVHERGAEAVIVDVTGVPEMDAAAVDLVVSLGRAVGLLGATCVLVGVSPKVAQALVEVAGARELPRCVRDLETALGVLGRAPPAGHAGRA